MKIWLDAQLSPAVASWMEANFDVEEAFAVQADPEFRTLKDHEIFSRARVAGAAVMTKDRDFVEMIERLGPPPAVIWITCGNTSNHNLRRILSEALPRAIKLIESGEPLVEIQDRE